MRQKNTGKADLTAEILASRQKCGCYRLLFLRCSWQSSAVLKDWLEVN